MTIAVPRAAAAFLRSALLISALSVRGATEGPAAHTVTFAYQPAAGLGKEAGICRRDPSDILALGDTWYLWYSRVTRDEPLYPSGYHATVWYATSVDEGHTWTERGEALGRRDDGFDSFGVFTPNMLCWNNRYYLYYTAVARGFRNAGYHDLERTAIGVAVADSPDGPWTRRPDPVLTSTRDPSGFDSFRVDDACLLVREGKVWLYYKGRQWENSPAHTKMGVAVADRPEGPFTRMNGGKPVQFSGHEVQIWKAPGGVYSLVSPAGPEGRTVQLATDGLAFRVVSRLAQAPPKAPGLCRPELAEARREGGAHWGICMATFGGDPYLQRFTMTTGAPRDTPARDAPREGGR